MIRGGLIAAAVAAATLLMGCGGGGSGSSLGQPKPQAKNYHDAAYLASDIRGEVKKRIRKDPNTSGMTVDSLDCIAKSRDKTDFTCLMRLGGEGTEDLSEEARSQTVDVTVAADGRSFITH